MRPSKIVFNQPFSNFLIKLFNIRAKVSELDKLVLDSLVETLIYRIIFGSSGPAPVMS